MMLSATLSTTFFIPIIILLGLASVFSLLISVLKLKFLPAFAIEILIGLSISHWFNGYMTSISMTSFVEGLYALGLVMIMFLSGYDVDFDLKGDHSVGSAKHISPLKTILLILVMVYGLSLLSTVFYLDQLTDKVAGIILLTLVFASSFAGMIVPLIHDGGISHNVIGKILGGIANFSEALSIIFLTVLMVVLKTEKEYLFIILLAAIILLGFRLFRKHRVGNFFNKVTEGIDHLPTRILFVLLLGMVFLSDLTGGEYILGAFVTGIFFRYSGFSQKVMESMTRIIYGVFAPMFFILVGTRIDIWEYFNNPSLFLMVLYIFITMLLVKLPMLYLLRCYRPKVVVSGMALMACTIVVPIAASHIGENLGLFSAEFGDSLILASLLICVFGTILFKATFPFSQFGPEPKDEPEVTRNENSCLL